MPQSLKTPPHFLRLPCGFPLPNSIKTFPPVTEFSSLLLHSTPQQLVPFLPASCSAVSHPDKRLEMEGCVMFTGLNTNIMHGWTPKQTGATKEAFKLKGKHHHMPTSHRRLGQGYLSHLGNDKRCYFVMWGITLTCHWPCMWAWQPWQPWLRKKAFEIMCMIMIVNSEDFKTWKNIGVKSIVFPEVIQCKWTITEGFHDMHNQSLVSMQNMFLYVIWYWIRKSH